MLPFADVHNGRLKGVVQVYREDKETGKVSLWEESENIIPISGYQWILMKMFGLYLDSPHNNGNPSENLSKDTTVVIPDLNDAGVFQLGVDPATYSPMSGNISSDHFVQGFMIGNGGSGEDNISTKNTDYSFIKLRNPIPFQQTQTKLPASIADKYTGVLRMGESSFTNSYFIKKFDDVPKIYHSWWKEGQRWDYVDPVTSDDLGPDANNGVGKTNRIETYVECKLSVDEDDCIRYFNHQGSTQTAYVNELGLVAYDAKLGDRSITNKMYESYIKPLMTLIFDNTLDHNSADVLSKISDYVDSIVTLNEILKLESYGQANIDEFMSTINILERDIESGSIDQPAFRDTFASVTNIEVKPYYNQDGSLAYTTDKFSDYIKNEKFDNMSTDEAQRIKMVTYYTFKSIPLQSNSRLLINYRIYAN